MTDNPVQSPLTEFEKNIYLDKKSFDELIEKFPGANVKKEAITQLHRVRKNHFLFEDEERKYFFLDKIGESILIHNKNNHNKAKAKKLVEEIIQNFFDKTELAEKIWEVQPYFYDKSKLWWLWDKDNFKWEVVDETQILVMVKNASVANTINSKERNEIVEAMRQFGREKIPKPINPLWIQFKDTIVDIRNGEEMIATPEYFATNPIP